MKLKQLIITENDKPQSMPTNVRKKINNALHDLTSPSKYFQTIPFDKITDILEKNGAVPIQEDNTYWSGFFTGKEGSALIRLASKNSEQNEFYTPYKNVALSINWYKMESGKYEVVAYIS